MTRAKTARLKPGLKIVIAEVRSIWGIMRNAIL